VSVQSINETAVSLVQRSLVEGSERIAIQSGDVALTYGDLDDRSAQVADALRRLGAEPGDLVGLCVERSAGLPVGALGIQLAGCAYVAIDPAYPDERVRWMLEDSGVTAVVTDEANAGRGAALGSAPTIVLTRDARVTGESPAQMQVLADEDPSPRAPAASPDPADLAYVVYTSGSTGHPKGVAVDHAALANLIAWHCAEFALAPSDRCTQIASPGFDAAMWELWPTLTAGASLHIVPEELRRDPLGLRDWLVTESITVSFLPTAVAETVIGLPWPEGGALRYLLTGGDALSLRPARALGFAVINNYGLSETAVVATSGVVAAAGDGPPSIGRAISGVLTEVVDEHQRPVAPGGEGELIVGGTAIARGYLNRPELTDERFFEDARGRWYRTGDRVRARADGQLDFLGRLDDQLSLRGFRVEPGEVVAALGAHPAIAAGAVVGEGSSSSDRRLLAYVVSVADEHPEEAELRDFVAARLPEYMVPASFVWLDQLPLTAHGKLDREALAAASPPTTISGSMLNLADRASASGVAETIAGVIAGLLEVERIDTSANFFLLGGHSMLGAQLIVRLEDLYGVEISLRFLFDHPTPAEIADEVERQLADDRDLGLVAG
jgi:amino acid adenylation domain-containing protein